MFYDQVAMRPLTTTVSSVVMLESSWDMVRIEIGVISYFLVTNLEVLVGLITRK